MGIILHHSAINDEKPQFQRVEDYHRNKWWFKSQLGFCCGYHAFIERSGLIIQARNWNEAGAHCYGFNKDIGICLAGDFRTMQPTKEQIESLSSLVSRLQSEYGIPESEIFNHYEKRSTSCPVIDLKSMIQRPVVIVSIPDRHAFNRSRLLRILDRARRIYSGYRLERIEERIMANLTS